MGFGRLNSVFVALLLFLRPTNIFIQIEKSSAQTVGHGWALGMGEAAEWAARGGGASELGVGFLAVLCSPPRGLLRRALGMDHLKGILCCPTAVTPWATPGLLMLG